MATIELNVAGMTCGGCEQSVMRALVRIAGVTNVEASHETGKVVIDAEHEFPREVLTAAIEDAGYEVVQDDQKRLPLI